MHNLGDMPSIVAIGLLVCVNGLIGYSLVIFGAPGFAVGAGISAVTAFIFFLYSYVTDRSLKSHLRDHRLAPGRAKMSNRAKKAREAHSMYASIDRLMCECSLLTTMGDKYEKVPDPDRLQFGDDLGGLHCNAVRSADELRRILRNAEYLDDLISDDILATIDLLKNAPPADGNGAVDTGRYREILDRLGPVQDRLERRLDLAAKRPAVAPSGLAVRLDRDTYPPGAAIRATVEAGGQLPNRKVTVTIFDEGLAVLDKKTETLPAQVMDRPAPSTIAVCMNTSPGKLAAGQEYIARATCGELHGEAAFAVEDIAPTVQAGVPTCTIGGNIAITVADPAAAAGSVGTGPSGTAGGQRLVVESPYDSIDAGSRLMVEDQSAGTFCVRVECAGARGCEGAEGAAVACGPNHLIRIRYESGAGEAWTAVLVEGPDIPSATDEGEPNPASTEGESGDDDGDGNGDGRHDMETERRGRKGNRVGSMQGGSKEARGRGQ